MFKHLQQEHLENLKTRGVDLYSLSEKEAVSKVLEEMEELKKELIELSSGIITENKDKIVRVLPNTLHEAVDVIRSIFSLYTVLGADLEYWWNENLKKNVNRKEGE